MIALTALALSLTLPNPQTAQASLAPAPAPATQEGFFQELEFDPAKLVAREQGKVILVFWWQVGNERCQAMERITWSSPEVREYVNSVAVPLSIEGEKNLPVSQRWRINTFPTTTLHDTNGKLIDSFEGYYSPADLISAAKASLYGRTADGSVARPTGDALQDPMAWFAYGNFVFGKNELVDETIYAYNWLLVHAAEKAPGFLDRHADLILKRLMFAGRVNPRAKETLSAHRDMLRMMALAGNLNMEELRALARIDAWLTNPRTTVDLFLELQGKGEKQEAYRKELVEQLLPELVAWKEYEQIQSVMGDVLANAQAKVQRYRELSDASGAEGATPSVATMAELDGLRTKIADLVPDSYETLLALGRGKDAETLAKSYLELFPTTDAHAVLMLRAGRHDLKEIARRIYEHGIQSVPDSDPRKQRLTRVMDRIDKGIQLGRRDADIRKEIEASREQARRVREGTEGGDGSGDGDGDGEGDGGGR